MASNFRSNYLSLLFCWTLITLFPIHSIAGDSIKAGESINDSHVIVSAAQKFELGFFTELQAPNFKYLGIWYKNISKTVVWVANRDNPIVNSSATLRFDRVGNLVLVNQTGAAFWSSNSTTSVKDPVAQLLDTGNLVLKDSGSEISLWQSFDYPSDTLLPGMKLGWDSQTGLNRKLTSRRSPSDPSSGELSYSVNTEGFPQLVVRKGNETLFRGGPWFGHGFGRRSRGANFVYNASFEISYSCNDPNNGPSRIVLDSAGSVIHYEWRDLAKTWHRSYTFDGAGCNGYKLCGNFGLCSSVLTASCGCLDGFEQKSPQNSSDGCVRKDPEICRAGERFKRISDVKWPDSTGELVKVKMGIRDCEGECMKNCSCLAYGTLEIPKIGPGCITWFHKLTDVRFVRDAGTGEDLFVRVAASELESTVVAKKTESNRKRTVVVVVATISAIIFLAFSWFIIRNTMELQQLRL